MFIGNKKVFTLEPGEKSEYDNLIQKEFFQLVSFNSSHNGSGDIRYKLQE